MRWRLEFYNEERRSLAHYSIEAPLPAEAVRLGWQAVLAEHPPGRAPRRLSLLTRAQRIGGQGGSGWILYRIANDNVHVGRTT
jgi:hypothetical protein